jgi:Tol biopolymer transport system component
VFLRETAMSGMAISPDYSRLAVLSIDRRPDAPFPRRLALYSFTSHSVTYSPCHDNFSGGQVEFTPDKKAVAYPVRDTRGVNIWVQPLDGSVGHAITDFPDDVIQSFRFSPDGKRLAFVHTHIEADVILFRDNIQLAKTAALR